MLVLSLKLNLCCYLELGTLLHGLTAALVADNSVEMLAAKLQVIVRETLNKTQNVKSFKSNLLFTIHS